MISLSRVLYLLEKARQTLRERVPFYDKDRFFAPDIDAAMQILSEWHLMALLPFKLLPG